MTEKAGAARADDGRAVTAALQAYADRGIFRGFNATPGPRGRTEYAFHWLLHRPTRVAFDAAAGTLTFPSLFPAVARGAMASGLDAIIAARATRAEPAHKRLDGRRASAASLLRGGGWSLVVTMKGTSQEYAVQRSLSLVNDLFLYLQESWPDYLIAHFGMSPE